MKSYAILLINSSEENYHYISDCLRKTQFAQFKVDWLRNENPDSDFFTKNKLSYHLYLIDGKTTKLPDLFEKSLLCPIIILKGDNSAYYQPPTNNNLFQLYYHQINPIVLEHFLQLSLYLKHQNHQIITQFEQSNALLEKEIRVTRNIITDINQYLLGKIDQEFIQSQFNHSSLSPNNTHQTIEDSNKVGIIRNNLAGHCFYCNQFSLQLFGAEEEQLLGTRWLTFVHELDRERVEVAWQNAHQQQSPIMLKYRLTKTEGGITWIYNQLTFESDAQQKIIGSVATMSAITESQAILQRLQREIVAKQEVTQAVKAANQQLQQLVNLDRVTQLANRFSFEGYFQQEWHRAEQKQMPLSLLLIDIDHFHQFNGINGYSQGDQCLKAIAKALKVLLKRPRDLLTRYGNDEFAVLLPDTPVEGAEVVARHILTEIQGLQISYHPQHPHRIITVSIGIAHLIPTATLTRETLLQFAESALRRAKNQGGNQWQTQSLEITPLMDNSSVAIDWETL
ncbi:MAG: GGDEF domain-containing protein [Synechocystis sp.]|nr:GGDEF domain-containing protein [Synechocystis sp.]